MDANRFDMLTAETAYLFTHGLLRDAAYELQLPEQRARLHRLTADVLELAGADGYAAAAEIAHHLAHAREHDADPALRDRERAKTRQAAEWAEKQFNHAETIRLWQRLSEIEEGREAANALRQAGRAAVYSGRSALAEVLLSRANELAIATADKAVQASALGGLANLYAQTGRLQQARVCHERALALHRELGDRKMEGMELGNLANLYLRGRQYAEAEPMYQLAIALHREVGNRLGEGVTISNLAGLYGSQERFDEAQGLYRQALAILDEVGDRRSIGIALSNLANMYRGMDQPQQAQETNVRALAVVSETGNRRYEGIVLGNLATIAAHAGRLEEALPLFRQALEIHNEVQNRQMEADHGCDYGLCLVRAGSTDIGRAQWQEAIGTMRSLGDAAGIEIKRTEMLAACLAAGIPPLEAGLP